jgi:ATP-dependent DNA ligase
VLLEDTIAGGNTYVLPARRLADNGLDAWAQVLGNGWESYVAKDQLSPYRGGVTRSWLKVKVPEWTDPEGKFKHMQLEIVTTRGL